MNYLRSHRYQGKEQEVVRKPSNSRFKNLLRTAFREVGWVAERIGENEIISDVPLRQWTLVL